ncbi:MAG TPA: hypothetical protein VFL91_26460 [Thermomicrobiales bacterium]|nr:hypothetical protein [Thermomicrobiales bacterium]
MTVTFALSDPPEEGRRIFLLLYVDVDVATLAAVQPEHAEHEIAAAMRRALDQYLAGRAILDQIHAYVARHQQQARPKRTCPKQGLGSPGEQP